MAEVFDWTPDTGATKERRPQVSVIKFGDGYEQRASFGINTMPQNWSVSFTNREKEEIDEIEAFLVARAGVEAFEWTPPDESEAMLFVCREWPKAVAKGNIRSISGLLFEQVFEPNS